ncbi:MAG: hypothetical protein ACM3UL_05345 [Ignavibacteria bacterium]
MALVVVAVVAATLPPRQLQQLQNQRRFGTSTISKMILVESSAIILVRLSTIATSYANKGDLQSQFATELKLILHKILL